MNDTYDTDKPDAAQLEATRAEIIAFRNANPTLTKTGLAVAFVEKRGRATSAELATLLGLAADQYPSVELSSAVQNGRVVRDGKNWTLGPNKVAYERRKDKPDALESGAELGKIEKPIEVPVFADKAVAEPAPAKPTCFPSTLLTDSEMAKRHESNKPLQQLKDALKPPRYRCALWSDGQVEIQRDGQTLASLPLEAVEELARFVSRFPAERAA